MGRLDGKVAFITGAARGQGRSHAVRLAQEGADIIALDLCAPVPSAERLYPGASADDMAETIDRVKQFGGRIVSATADVRDFDAVAKVVADGVTDFGGIDIVSANAGIFLFGDPAHEVSEDDWRDVLDINITGVWHTCKAVTPAMIDAGRGGSIVLTSSTAGIKGTPNVAPYTASKHAVVGLMKTLALELAPHSIRVNSIHPTGVATDMILNEATFRLFLPDEEHPTKEQAAPVFATTNALPVPWVESIDISNALLFLASDEARFITGNELKVDAGYCVK
ncbi:mycofactocin-coupled SDR family oxidoreductase [Gordonia hydrophobica]|uniref:Mycofactocin-coupled SDR family oxidoreductase n=1 Tax=Gordonia hydrophobica TaxID=40516 RepID=A0ABZ2TW98_9ACTN|nr:mycofactocin-coupled SDR family oxidoreductase [Gordonia hydrophobica]MBM7365833.1 (+)-trans-carveol dehydrogenase [Gordonia hydrophobica]